MNVETYVILTADEVNRTLPYPLIAETTSCSSWDTGRRRRMMEGRFTPEELEEIDKIIALSKQWFLKKGVPEEVRIRTTVLPLWFRFAEFCGEL